MKERQINVNSGAAHFRAEFCKSRAPGASDIRASLEAAGLHRQKLMNECGGPLVCVSLNLPGPYKRFPLAELCFSECRRAAELALEAAGTRVKRCGPPDSEGAIMYAYYQAESPGVQVKRMMCEIEENHPAGRLFNIDVYTCGEDTAPGAGAPAPVKLTRAQIGLPRRNCPACGDADGECPHAGGNGGAGCECPHAGGNGGAGCECPRKGANGDGAPTEKLLEIMWSWARLSLSDHINKTAARALYGGLAIAPKTGLAHPAWRGAGADFFEYIDLYAGLLPYYQECALAGFDGADAVVHSRIYGNLDCRAKPPMLPSGIRRAGELACARIARSGGDAHKGLIFSLGILCAAYGWLFRSKTDFTAGELFDFCRDISASVMHGACADVTCEVARGFEYVRDYGLPALRDAEARGCDINDAGVSAFLALLARVDDAGILRSSNKATLKDIQRAASAFLLSQPSADEARKWAEETELQFMDREINAVCCADLMTVALFVRYLL